MCEPENELETVRDISLSLTRPNHHVFMCTVWTMGGFGYMKGSNPSLAIPMLLSMDDNISFMDYVLHFSLLLTITPVI